MYEGLVETLRRRLEADLLNIVLLIKIIVEFRTLIHTVIPDIIQLTKDGDWEVYEGAAEALLTLSDHRKTANLFVPALLMKIIVEFQPLIGTAIPGIAESLTDDSWICQRGIAALSKLSEKGKTSQCFLFIFS
jgi:hypothetical protein